MRMRMIVTGMLLLCGTTARAQLVNVTFRANVAGVPDTLGPKGLVQIRGTTVTPAGRTIDDNTTDTLSAGVLIAWNGQTTMNLQHISGDYWEGTFAMPAGVRLCYKFFTNALHDTVYPGADWEHQGWEGSMTRPADYVYGGDRGLDLLTFAGADTVLPLQFVNGWKSGAEQYDKPYVETDSIDIYFRVNMQTQEDLNAETQVVGIRGAAAGGFLGDLSWDQTHPLNRESKHVNSGSSLYSGTHFWSGRVRISPDDVTEGQEIPYKFVIADRADPLTADPPKWEGDPNRVFRIPKGKADTTLAWDWFDHIAPTPVTHNDPVRFTFFVDMREAIQNRGFSPGDTVEVRAGYFGTATEVVSQLMRRQGISSVYRGQLNVRTTLGQLIDYQYYVYKNGRDYREVYYNFHYTGDNAGEAERRQVLVSEDNPIVNDTLRSKIDARRMPVFRNVQTLARDVLVTFTCDLRPAYYTVRAGKILNDIQGTLHVMDADSVMAWGVAMNGPATGSWSNNFGPDWGAHLMTLENKRMYDDGTNGDAVAGDSIFTIQFQYRRDSLDVVGQEFKFGIGGGDNEGGEGGYGNNHIENIDDSQPTAVIHNQFGSINPAYYDAWDFDNQSPSTAVLEEKTIPATFALGQNYPNPFNPVTTITYRLARAEKVSLVVYNIRGERVATLVQNEKQMPGSYEIFWDGRDDRGIQAGSGVYIYHIIAGDFKGSHKMLLVK